MIQEELVTFIRTQLQKGVSEQEILTALLQAGWEPADVEDSVKAGQPGAQPQQPAAPAQPQPPMMPTQPLSEVQSMGPSLNLPNSTPAVDMFDTKPAAQSPWSMPQTSSSPFQQPAQPQQPVAPTFTAQPVMPNPMMQQNTMASGQPQMPTTPAFTAQPQAASSLFEQSMMPGNQSPMNQPSPFETQPAAAYSPMSSDHSGVVVSPVKPVMKDGMSTRTKILVFGLIGLVIAAAIAVGLYLYMQYLKSPSRVQNLSYAQFADLHSFDFSANVVTSKNSTDQTMAVTGAVSLDTAASYDVEMTVSTQKNGKATGTPATIILRQVGDKAYFRSSEQTMTSAPDQWYETDDQKALVSSQTIAEHLTQAKGHPFFTLATYQGKESVENVSMLRYAGSLHGEGMKTLTPTFFGSSDSEIAAVPDAADATIWIDAKTYQVRRIQSTWTSAQAGTVTIDMKMWNQNTTVQIDTPEHTTPLPALLQDIFFNTNSTDTTNGGNTNVNTNAAINSNLNTNEATNANENTNTTVNENTNTVVNANTNAATNANSNTNTSVNQNTNTTPDPNSDQDGDGLTYAQELQYHTNPLDPDSDDDGFLDGEEVKNGYNPNGSGKLPQ